LTEAREGIRLGRSLIGGEVMSQRKKRSRTGEALSAERTSPEAETQLEVFVADARSRNALDEWRRGEAMLRYMAGQSVISIAQEMRVSRGSVNLWLRWYETMGLEGLKTWKPNGAKPKLSVTQKAELVRIVEAGPQASGFESGVWTGPMVGQVIRDRFGVSYHNHTIPPLLHRLGFSLQRPRKRLCRADAEKQRDWVEEKLPTIKKKPLPAGGC